MTFEKHLKRDLPTYTNFLIMISVSLIHCFKNVYQREYIDHWKNTDKTSSPYKGGS